MNYVVVPTSSEPCPHIVRISRLQVKQLVPAFLVTDLCCLIESSPGNIVKEVKVISEVPVFHLTSVGLQSPSHEFVGPPKLNGPPSPSAQDSQSWCHLPDSARSGPLASLCFSCTGLPSPWHTTILVASQVCEATPGTSQLLVPRLRIPFFLSFPSYLLCIFQVSAEVSLPQGVLCDL